MHKVYCLTYRIIGFHMPTNSNGQLICQEDSFVSIFTFRADEATGHFT